MIKEKWSSMNKLRKRAFAVTLATAVASTSFNIGSIAVNAGTSARGRVIVAFEELPEDIAEQTLPIGGSRSDLNFPEELDVVLYSEDKEERPTEEEGSAGVERLEEDTSNDGQYGDLYGIDEEEQSTDSGSDTGNTENASDTGSGSDEGASDSGSTQDNGASDTGSTQDNGASDTGSTQEEEQSAAPDEGGDAGQDSGASDGAGSDDTGADDSGSDEGSGDEGSTSGDAGNASTDLVSAAIDGIRNTFA
ncbi:MAG: hypothetical protein K6E90_05015, partial [Lachnospiraceae bacterium]|nr:hypothetical protein [Lachnospiraceae bacterium]